MCGARAGGEVSVVAEGLKALGKLDTVEEEGSPFVKMS